MFMEYKMLQISHVDSAGDFVCPDHQPVVVEPWCSASTGNGDQEEMVDYRCVSPLSHI